MLNCGASGGGACFSVSGAVGTESDTVQRTVFMYGASQGEDTSDLSGHELTAS